MSELSPAAQAVLDAAKDAYGINYSEFHCCADRVTAAALRAAVNAVAPDKTIEDIDYVHQSYLEGYMDALYEILIIANELEAQ